MDKGEFLSLSTETMKFLSFSNDYLLMSFPLCFLHSFAVSWTFSFLAFVSFFFFLRGAGCHVAQDSPKFTVTDVDFKVLLLVSLDAKCWDDRHGPTDPASDCSGCIRFFELKYKYTTSPFPNFLSSPPVFLPSLRLRL